MTLVATLLCTMQPIRTPKSAAKYCLNSLSMKSKLLATEALETIKDLVSGKKNLCRPGLT